MAQAKKRKHLQSTFGPEYDRTVEGSGKRREAERELAEREERRRSLDIRPLPEQDRVAFADRWRTTQGDFVDHPEMAVRQADLLVAEVMGRRGYPVGDFDQYVARRVRRPRRHRRGVPRRARDLRANDRKQASTEQLRQAMVHYRSLFTRPARRRPALRRRRRSGPRRYDRQHQLDATRTCPTATTHVPSTA